VLGHLAEGTPNVGSVERSAKLRRDDKIIVGPSCRVAHATLGLPASVRSKCNYAFVRKFKGAPGSSVLVSAPSRTDRHSCTLGGSPSRSVWLQVSARNSSVRAPVSNETTT
jgi:hypothetical protein